jgi:hypothetical protein
MTVRLPGKPSGLARKDYPQSYERGREADVHLTKANFGSECELSVAKCENRSAGIR